MMEEEDPFEQQFAKYRMIDDRFSFDDLFRWLLHMGLGHEEAKEAICCNCSLSAMILQERIYNKYYLRISEDERISEDLREFRNEIFAKWRPSWAFN